MIGKSKKAGLSLVVTEKQNRRERESGQKIIDRRQERRETIEELKAKNEKVDSLLRVG